jgi:organic hydroperoxide reductase OsmC/OhrA
MHHYRVTSRWSGSTGVGYDGYDRTHTVSTAPPTETLTLSSDPAFRGDPALLDPEELFVIAASSCQLLSFLAVASRARIDVVEYVDDAEGFMPDDLKPVRITEITLRPRITVRGEVTEERVRHLCEVAHRECYIANSVTTEITIDPEITITERSLG